MGAQTEQRIAALEAEVAELRQAVTFTTALGEDVERIKQHFQAQEMLDRILKGDLRSGLEEPAGIPQSSQPGGGRRGPLRLVNGGRQ